MRHAWKAALMLLVLAFLWFVWPTRWQYYMVTESRWPSLRVDRITGTVEEWSSDDDKWELQ